MIKQDGQGRLEAGKPGRRLRDASGLNEGSDWDRLELKLDRYDSLLGYWSKELKEGRKGIKEDRAQVLAWGIGWMVTVHTGTVYTARRAGLGKGVGSLPGVDCQRAEPVACGLCSHP